MNVKQRSIFTAAVAFVIASLACSPLGGGAATKNTPIPSAPPAATVAAASTPTSATGGEATATSGEATTTGGEATATEGEATSTSTYDAIAAQLTVPPLLTANAATANAATGSVHQWAAAAKASTQYGDVDWAATQATGAPNSPSDCGDQKTAWASASSSTADTLELVYTTTVVPVAVNIYENNAPGSIVRVDVKEASGTPHTVYAGAPLVSPECPRIFTVAISGVTAKVNSVVVYLDQSVIGKWDEIDAVELVGNP